MQTNMYKQARINR